MPRRSRPFREGWNTALEAVAHGIDLLSIAKAIEGTPALDAVSTMVMAMAAPPARYFATNRALARKYGVSRRTITNWRKEGCPFHKTRRKVLDWIARRRYAPKGTEAKFKDQLSDRRIRGLMAQMKASFAETRALKELHKFCGIEPDAWLKQFRCPKNGKGDPRFLALKERFEKDLAG